MDPNASATFEFSREDYSRIIFKDSLFSVATREPAGVSSRTLERLQERETRLYLHAVTLSDYMRAKRIPRGLRINKGPIISRDKDTFCDRWSEILNKCSFDLMALTIQEASTNLAMVREEITTVKQQLESEHTDPDKYKQLLEECEYHKNELVKEITASKKKKFERDAADYDSGRIYQWRNPPPGRSRGSRPESGYARGKYTRHNIRYDNSHQSTTDLEYDSESSAYSQTSGPFLGNVRRNEPKSPYTGARKNAGEGRVPPSREPYRTRQTQKRNRYKM